MPLRLLVAAAGLALGGAPAAAQTVDPPFEVHQGQARSSFVVRNDALVPLTYVIEARAFDIASCGDLAFEALDTARVHLRLSSMSGRLPARQQRRIQYDITADSLPAWVAFVITFGSAGRDPGLGTRLEVVHFAYLNQRTPLLPADVVIREAGYDPAQRRTWLIVENRSDKLSRLITMTVVDAAGDERAVEACPFLPRSTRIVDVPWTGVAAPVKAVLRFPGFSVDAPIVVRSAPQDSTRASPR